MKNSVSPALMNIPPTSPGLPGGRTSEDVQKKKLSVSVHLLFKTKNSTCLQGVQNY